MLKNKLLSAMGGPPIDYIEDVFSTYLYTGNGSTQTITNGIDLAGKGGLVWIKNRSNAGSHLLFDTVRGADNLLQTNQTNAQNNSVGYMTTFNAAGFGLTSSLVSNASAQTYASWTFRKQPKFFDVVTWTGNGAGSQTISHALGSTPGCIIVKRTNSVSSWFVYHRGGQYGQNGYLTLQSTNAENVIGADVWTPTSTTFQANNTFINLNVSGGTYVAYIFAHNAGGFGPSQSDNVISCGSYVADGTDKTITLGYEPQWVMVKRATDIGDWIILDTQRGWSTGTESYLKPNTSGAEDTGNTDGNPTSTGFLIQGTGNLGVAYAGSNQTMLYVAIRKNMKS